MVLLEVRVNLKIIIELFLQSFKVVLVVIEFARTDVHFL